MPIGESSDLQSALLLLRNYYREDEEIVRHQKETFGLLHQNSVLWLELSNNQGHCYDTNQESKRVRVTPNLTEWDAYVLRETNARTDYDKVELELALDAIEACLRGETQTATNLELKRLEGLSAKFQTVSIRGAEFVKRGCLADIDKDYLISLSLIIKQSLKHKPAQLKLIHDGYGAICNHVNTLKTHYNNVLVSIYMGVWLFKVIEKLTGTDYSHQLEPIDMNIVAQIRNSKYSLM